MPGPLTSNPPQVNQSTCAGDLVSALRDFKEGCIDVRVPAGKTLILSGVGLGVSVISVERVLEGDCGVDYYLPMQTNTNCPLALSAATPMQPIKVQGLYRLCISPPSAVALVKEELIESDSAACCSITARCQPADPALPPVVAAVTGVPCPLVAPFVWQGLTYVSVSAFIADVQTQVSNAVYNAITCQFTAPAGSVFPALVLAAPSIAGVVYCPTQPLLDGGFGYHLADPRDPAATVEITPCPGDLTVDTIYIYPAAAPGRTAKVSDCAGVAIGYGANKSACAPECPCTTTCAPAVAASPPPPPVVRTSGWASAAALDGSYAASNTGTYNVPDNPLDIPAVFMWLSAIGTYAATDVVTWQTVWTPVTAGTPAPITLQVAAAGAANARLRITVDGPGSSTGVYFDGALQITMRVNGVATSPVRTLIISSRPGLYVGPDGFTWA